MFTNLPTGCEAYQAQISEEYKTFLTFDNLHILKTIKNNSLDQKNSEKTFVHPSFTNYEQKN